MQKANHLAQFARDAFDYIVIDEFHHAASDSYRRLVEYFQPRYLLGLTATPERRLRVWNTRMVLTHLRGFFVYTETHFWYTQIGLCSLWYTQTRPILAARLASGR
jgi:superfamily II DNA or RNA helicase